MPSVAPAVRSAAYDLRTKLLELAGDVFEVAPDDLQIVDGVVSVKGAPESSINLGTISVLSNPLRYAFDEAAKAATQFAGTPDMDKPPVGDDEEPGAEPVDDGGALDQPAVEPPQPDAE